jgi:azurin
MQNVVITKTSDLAKRLFRGFTFCQQERIVSLKAARLLSVYFSSYGVKVSVTVGTESLIDEQYEFFHGFYKSI